MGVHEYLLRIECGEWWFDVGCFGRKRLWEFGIFEIWVVYIILFYVNGYTIRFDFGFYDLVFGCGKNCGKV